LFRSIKGGSAAALAFGLATTVVVGCSDSTTTGVLDESGAVANVSVAIDSATLQPKDVAQAKVSVTNAQGAQVNDQPIVWSSLNPSVATVSSNGVVTAVDTGTALVLATVGSKSGKTNVIVRWRPQPGQTPAPAPTPAPAGPSVLATSTFESGKLDPFTNPWGTDIDIVDDPTGSGHGKVARYHYAGTAQDRNRSLMYENGKGIGPGETIHFSGQFYLPNGINTSPAFAARKLLYFQPDAASGKTFSSIITMYGTQLSIVNGYVAQNGSTVEVKGPTAPFTFQTGRWYKIETQITLNTSFTSNNGVYRCWIDGQLVYENTKMSWSDPKWTPAPAPQKLRYFLVGDQVNASGSFDEYRYWDNVTFSTVRVAP
jgi:hypothetical protein